MAFVPIPNDLSKVKSKVALGLTGRQLGLGALALVVGIPAYLLTYYLTNNSTLSLLALMVVASPFMFFALFEKDGMTGEKWLKQVIKVKFQKQPKRVYKNDNSYRFIKEVNDYEDKYESRKRNKT